MTYLKSIRKNSLVQCKTWQKNGYLQLTQRGFSSVPNAYQVHVGNMFYVGVEQFVYPLSTQNFIFKLRYYRQGNTHEKKVALGAFVVEIEDGGVISFLLRVNGGGGARKIIKRKKQEKLKLIIRQEFLLLFSFEKNEWLLS